MHVIIMNRIFNNFNNNLITKHLYTLSTLQNDIDKQKYCDYIMYNNIHSINPISIKIV